MSFNIEKVPAKLEPFDLLPQSLSTTAATVTNGQSNTGTTSSGNQSLATSNATQPSGANQPASTSSVNPGIAVSTATPQPAVSQPSSNVVPQATQAATVTAGPLVPIYASGGLIFMYPPTISESVGVKYDSIDLVHSNESVFAYRNTDNAKLTLSNCIWTCDTFENAVYALGVIHFLRTYSLMDFGRRGKGAPPAPMWFSAYGTFAYNSLPVLMERYEFTFPNHENMDYVGVPAPGTSAFNNQQLSQASSPPSGSSTPTTPTPAVTTYTTDYTWIPMKLEVSISLIVQHSLKYWTDAFTLDDFRNGNMLDRNRAGKNTVTQTL